MQDIPIEKHHRSVARLRLIDKLAAMKVTDSEPLAAEFMRVLHLWRTDQLEHLLAPAVLPSEPPATGPTAIVPLH